MATKTQAAQFVTATPPAARSQSKRLTPRQFPDELRDELCASGVTPTMSELVTIAGADPSGVFVDERAIGAHESKLFANRMPQIVREASGVVSPLRLAMAVRSWEPDLENAGVYPRLPRTQRELERLSEQVHDLDEDVRILRDRPTVAARCESLLAQLDRELCQTRSWMRHRRKRADPEAQAIDAVEQAQLGSIAKLPPLVERACKAAKLRWWTPVADELRADLSWGRAELAELLLADAWFAELIPIVRRRYRNTRTMPALAEAIGDVTRRR